MKVPAALLTLAMAGAVVAQGAPELPSCAQSCADKFLTGGIGDCGSDPKCICSNKDFLGSIACCLVGVCDPPAQSSAVAFAATLCKGFGVTDLPTAVACATASGAAVTTTAASASTTGSSASSAATDSGSPAATTGAASTSQTSAATAATAAQSTSKSTNYGPRPTAAAGLGAIGGIMAAVALL